MLDARADGRLEAMCSRCLASSPIVETAEALEELGWELRAYAPRASRGGTRSDGPPLQRQAQRGVLRKRRRTPTCEKQVGSQWYYGTIPLGCTCDSCAMHVRSLKKLLRVNRKGFITPLHPSFASAARSRPPKGGFCFL